MGYIPPPSPHAPLADLEAWARRGRLIRFLSPFVGLLLGLAIVALVSCGYSTAGRAERPGVYTCRSPEPGAPIYRLNTEDPETLFFRGDGGGLQFRDLTTGREIRLREGERSYRCTPEVL